MKRARAHEAPDHLSDRSKALWHQLVPSRAKSPGRLAMIRIALEDLDLHDQAREEVGRSGLTFVTATTQAVHIHPLLRVAAEAHARFVTLWKQLDFVFDEQIDE